MANTNNMQSQDLEHLHHEGNKALVINIIFFVVLFVGILLVPLVGIGFASIAISLSFIVSMLYIYLA
ncbi:MAG: hypothetical protein KGZ63_02045 [Clostridiales bacterium]|nr:hypothetical protein [Clostridiales bacterium]